VTKILPPPQILVKGGQDMDGTWGATKTFTREFYFELINVPLPLFMMSSFIPAYNSLHPYYPWALAKESKCTKNVETNAGRGITISTNYQILKPAVPFNGVGFTLADVIAGNMPFLLPAQDVSYEPVAIEEPLDDLYVEKTQKEIEREALELDIDPDKINRWKQVPFQTTAGTKLTGTRLRNILKRSFWYLADPLWFEESAVETQYTGVVNHAPVTIAGKNFKTGSVKIESLEIEDSVWERADVAHLSMKMVRVSLLIDKKSWLKEYENVSHLFMAYPYVWQKANSGSTGLGDKKNTKMNIDACTNQPYYYFKTADGGQPVVMQTAAEENEPSTESPTSDVEYSPSLQRIFCTMYDPAPKNEGSTDDPIYVQDPQKAIQFFGTREDCFRLNPDSEPTEVSEPMYLDKNGFMLYPDPDTGKVDTALSPKIKGSVFKPMDFTPLHFPHR